MPWYDKEEAFRVGITGVALTTLGVISMTYPFLAGLHLVPGYDLFWQESDCRFGCLYKQTGWFLLLFWLGVVIAVIGCYRSLAWNDYFYHKRRGR